MRTSFVVLLGLLAGCQAAPKPLPVAPLVPPTPVPESPAISVHEKELEAKVAQQRYIIDALLSQLEALKAGPLPSAPEASLLPVAPPLPQAVAPLPAPSEPSTLLLPNAEGVVDLTAAAKAMSDGETVNPFTVRAATPAKETTIMVQGIVPGAHPCAVVNDRPVEPGDAVGPLRVARIEADAVYFSRGDFLVKVRLGGPVVRVRHT
jgi:hypothetical protein